MYNRSIASFLVVVYPALCRIAFDEHFGPGPGSVGRLGRAEQIAQISEEAAGFGGDPAAHELF